MIMVVRIIDLLYGKYIDLIKLKINFLTIKLIIIVIKNNKKKFKIIFNQQKILLA